MEKEIPTAKLILSKTMGTPMYRMDDDAGEYPTKSGAIEAMIEFAKLHVQQFAEQNGVYRRVNDYLTNIK